MLVHTNRRSPNGLGTDLLGPRNRVAWFLESPTWFAPRAQVGVTTWIPPVDLFEDGETYRAFVELPGISAEDITLSFENNVLTIRGHKELPSYGEARLHRQERTFGDFERALALPTDIDADSIQASFENGILMVSMTKPERARARTIPVQVIANGSNGT